MKDRFPIFFRLVKSLSLILLTGFLFACAGSKRPSVTESVTRNLEMSGLDISRVKVGVEGNSIWLEGAVPSKAVSSRLEEIAIRTSGVMVVRNELEVSSVSSSSTLESSPAQRFADRVRSDPGLKNYDISVVSEEGQVVVTGEVESEDELQRIFELAHESESPERSVEYRINVTSSDPSDEEISQLLSERMAKMPRSVTESIAFSVDNGVVTFSGRVVQHETIDQLLSQTLMLPGVRKVKSNVKINGI